MTAKRQSVLFIQEVHSLPFAELASALREAGVDSEFVSGRSAAPIALAKGLHSRLVRGPGMRVGSIREPAEIRLSVDRPFLDVHAPEDVVDSYLAAAGTNGKEFFGLHNKAAMTELAEKLGYPVPVTYPSDEPPPSYPVVVKAALGAGGRQVIVAHDEEQWRRAVHQLARTGGEVLTQEFCPGEVRDVGGVVKGGQFLLAGAYRSWPMAGDPLGPPETIEIVPGKEMIDAMAGILAETDYTGFINADFVRGSDGELKLIDVNPRAFASWSAMQLAGFDLLGAYLVAIGAADDFEASPAPIGTRSQVLRFGLREQPGTAAAERAARVWIRGGIDARAPLLGERWRRVALITLAAAGTVWRMQRYLAAGRSRLRVP